MTRSGGRSRRWIGAAALAVMPICAWGCGGGSDEGVPFERGSSPPPRRCLERWNADQGTTEFGRHSYVSHKSRAARVFAFRGENASERECAVIFAVSESDREFGTVGQASASAAWEIMSFVGGIGDPVEAQRRAARSANAGLRSDGRLAPLD
jgi:hypothetical protein